MPPKIATFVFAAGIVGLFALDRDRTVRTSKALWLPVIWIWIVGSRPVSVWLGMSPSTVTASQLLEGSPFDRVVFQVLLAAGIVVLIRRSSRTSALLRANWPILLYFCYCLLSVLWSDFPGVALKRWTKAIGDLVMVLVVMTDPKPAAALRRLLSRTGFILLPASVLLIKYFGDLGLGFDPYGELSVTGVTTNKNLLGVITFVLSLAAVWRVLKLLRTRGQPNRSRQLLAQGVLLAFGLGLLVMAHSATSGACFALGAGLMLATGLPVIGRRPAAVHALVLVFILAGGLTMLFGGDADVVHAMGRQTDFTGRKAIWEAVIPMAPNPLFGAGFESFWLGPRLDKLWRAFPVFQPNEAHNGYIEVYLNLGCMGLGLIALILVNGYWRAVAAFRRDPAIGGLMLAYIAAASIYSVTEAGFRLLDPIWIFLLLAVVGAGSVTSIADGRAPRTLGAVPRPSLQVVAPSDTLVPLGRNN
jgi:exopolysaccharide production protein ExoQ